MKVTAAYVVVAAALDSASAFVPIVSSLSPGASSIMGSRAGAGSVSVRSRVPTLQMSTGMAVRMCAAQSKIDSIVCPLISQVSCTGGTFRYSVHPSVATNCGRHDKPSLDNGKICHFF